MPVNTFIDAPAAFAHYWIATVLGAVGLCSLLVAPTLARKGFPKYKVPEQFDVRIARAVAAGEQADGSQARYARGVGAIGLVCAELTMTVSDGTAV